MNSRMIGTMLCGAMAVCVVATAHAQSTPPPTAQQPTTRTQAAAPAMNADHQLVVDGAKGNMAEVELGKLAEQKGTRDDVKQFGRRMVADHTKANEQLKTLAQSESIPWPADMDAKHKETIQRLSKLSGAAFDKAYMQQMVQDHTEKIAKLRSVAPTVKDPEIKAWVERASATPQEHLKLAQSIANAPVGTGGSKTP
jgi:putative membrane protein